MRGEIPLDPNTFGVQPCFGCSPSNGAGLKLTFARDGEEIVTRYLPPEHLQGPPGILHGGLVMTVADELAAWTIVGLKERLGFTAAVDGRFRAPVRIGVEVEGRGRIVSDAGRVLKVEVVLRQAAVDVFIGTFTFALLDRSGAERLLGRALPDAWQRFCR
jgi:acyl-coenzyme A thioesterase PaaI-like protein